ncbi:MAG: tetratricopeptide repeat protein, partial [Candidatus Acidiferrum sp.]
MANFQRVLEQDPNRDDVRQRLAEVALGVGLLDVAAEQFQYLQERKPGEASIAYRLGLTFEARNQHAAAAKWYRTASELEPTDLDAYIRLANVLRVKLGKQAEADGCLDDMVRANPQSVRAYLARAVANKEADRLQAADSDVKEAMRLAPDDADALLLAADLGPRLGRPVDDARKHLLHALAKHGDDPRCYEALAALEIQQNNREAALSRLREGLRRIPDNANLLWNEANLLIGLGRLDEARPALARLQSASLPPGRQEFLHAALQVQSGYWREGALAFETIRPLLTTEPALAVQADLLLGECFRMIG